MDLIKATPRNKNGSMSFTIPKNIVDSENIKHGDQYFVKVKNGSIIFDKAEGN